MRVQELRVTFINRNTITLQLRPDHLGLSPGNLLHAKGEFLHGNLVLGFIPVAIHRRTGQLEDGLTHGLAGDRARMNRNTSDHCGPVNYSDVLACLSRSDSRLLACGATANHDPSSAAAAKVFSQLKEVDGKWHMEGMAGNGPSGPRNPNRWHPGMRSQVTLAGPENSARQSEGEVMNARVAVQEQPRFDEISEWVEAFDQVLAAEGEERAAKLVAAVCQRATQAGVHVPARLNTPYVNTIPVAEETRHPGDLSMERRINALVRWNAMAMVHCQNKKDPGIGGHISTYSSAVTLFEVGFNHFFRARYGDQPGDFVYFQGHASPGVYARAFLEGRLNEEHLQNFRHELRGSPGLSSYPHPWLMPSFWKFPTVSMGFGPIHAIYQARFMRYLESRNLIVKTPRKVWAFVGMARLTNPNRWRH